MARQEVHSCCSGTILERSQLLISWEQSFNVWTTDYDSSVATFKHLGEDPFWTPRHGLGGLGAKARAATAVWWPGINKEIVNKVQQCPECAKNQVPAKEPLISTPLPDYPWQMAGVDLFELNNKQYLLLVDYFSRYPEVRELKSTTSKVIIQHLKSLFSHHGIPEILRSDNGPQFSSLEFAKFASTYEFQHTTSSPRFPQSNGQVERFVKTMKAMMSKSEDPYLALLSYRSTPLPWCSLSPAELCMGRKIRTTIPQSNQLLIPKWPYLQEFRQKNKVFKQKQVDNYNKRHRVQVHSPLPITTQVWITSEDQPVEGRMVELADTPRSYVIETPTGQVQRNRHHINTVPEHTSQSEDQVNSRDNGGATSSNETPTIDHSPLTTQRHKSPIITRSRSGTRTYRPDYKATRQYFQRGHPT